MRKLSIILSLITCFYTCAEEGDALPKHTINPLLSAFFHYLHQDIAKYPNQITSYCVQFMDTAIEQSVLTDINQKETKKHFYTSESGCSTELNKNTAIFYIDALVVTARQSFDVRGGYYFSPTISFDGTYHMERINDEWRVTAWQALVL